MRTASRPRKSRLVFKLSCIGALAGALSGAASTVTPPVLLTDYHAAVVEGDWSAAFKQALQATPAGAALRIPYGPDYVLEGALDLDRPVILQFDPGVRIEGRAEALFRILGDGIYAFEGTPGMVTLANVSEDAPHRHTSRLLATNGVSSVICLNAIPEGFRPDVRVAGLRFEGLRGIDGYTGFGYQPTGGGVGRLDVRDAVFDTGDAGIAHGRSSIDSVIIRGCTFQGTGNYGLYLPTIIRDFAIIRENRFIGIGINALQVGGGRTFAIDEGAVEDIRNVIVHDNILLGGGHNAHENVSYIHGILVYGNQISIQGNLVRDLHRGESIPGQPVGRQLRTRDGTVLESIWMPRDDGQRARRLAGAAIYAKARHGIIANNICVNSGWRSVIEVKTGGREPYVLVANNIVDGSALAREDSFGLETGVAHGLWVNNILADMPVLAAKASNRNQSAFLNNLVVNAPIGFQAFGAAQQEDSLIQGNVFFNVDQPVRTAARAHERTTSVAAPPMLLVRDAAALPPATERNRGQMALVQDSRDDTLYAVLRRGGEIGWYPVTLQGDAAGKPLVIEDQAPLQPEHFRPRAGAENLLVNPDHALDAPTDTADGREARFPYGWRLGTSLDGVAATDVAAYDSEVQRHGVRTLRIGDHEGLYNWVLAQTVDLEPGKTYYVRSEVLRETRANRIRLQVRIGDLTFRQSFPRTTTWDEAELAFTVPRESNGRTEIRLWSDMTGSERRVWVGPTGLFAAEQREPSDE